MKYVILRDQSADMLGTPKWPKGGQIMTASFWQDIPILFGEEIVHSVMTEQLKVIYPGLKVVAAGFCHLTRDGWHCEGRSTSLGISSRPRDGQILNRMTPFHGI